MSVNLTGAPSSRSACRPIADTQPSALIGELLNFRSPWLPFNIGGVLLLLSMLVWWLTDQELLAWILLGLATPLLLEGEAWREAAYSAHYFYEVDSEAVHWEAYNPQAALPRYLLLYVYFFAILIGDAHILPENGWEALAIIVAPFLLYAGLAVRSFMRDIRQLMRSKGIQSHWSRRHNRN